MKEDMSTKHTRNHRISSLLGAALAGVLALAACGSSDGEEPEASATDAETSQDGDATTDEGEWPRTFTNADGTTTEIPAKPERIASTAVSVTGTLLAIEAPVVASGGQGDSTFFPQWDDAAQASDVEVLWSAGEVDLEALYAVEPDLIVVATSGRDALTDNVAEFNEIAPTIVVDYGGQTWQELAAEFGEATGLETEAQATIDEFDSYVAQVRDQITVPEGQANIISFNGPGEDNPIGRTGGAQAQLLAELGFDIEDPDVTWHTQEQEREDFVWTSYENLSLLTAETTFILSADNETAQAFADDPVLANVPSVQAGQVYGLGLNSFRLDLYSATEIVDGVLSNFGN